MIIIKNKLIYHCFLFKLIYTFILIIICVTVNKKKYISSIEVFFSI